MATLYVRSTDGNNSDNGTTWALAKADLTGAAAIDAAGDTIWVSQNHAESTAAAITFSWAGTASSPVKILCGNDAAEPPTSFSSAATVTTTGGTSNILISGSCYVQGINFVSSNNIKLNNTGGVQFYKDCQFKLNSTGGDMTPTLVNVVSKTTLKNCSFYFTNSQNTFTAQHCIHIDGGSIASGTTSPTNFLRAGVDGRGGTVLVENFDFTNASSSMNLVGGSLLASGSIVFRNCKLPASWSGSLVNGTIAAPGLRVSMYNCDNANTNYLTTITDYSGDIYSGTLHVRTGGATDGTTSLSWSMQSRSTATEYFPLYSDDIAIWNETTGSSVTVTVDILNTTATNLKDNEIWLEVKYAGTSGYPLGVGINDSRADLLTTAADQTTSSATWDTSGIPNNTKQKLSVTFTPQKKGWIIGRVALAKASATVYVDPLLQLS